MTTEQENQGSKEQWHAGISWDETVKAAVEYTESKQEGKSKEGDKSKEASMVLKEMDNQEEPNYTAALNKVLKETGANKAKLEKELDKYI